MTGREIFFRAWDFLFFPGVGLFVAGGMGLLIGIVIAVLLMIHRKK